MLLEAFGYLASALVAMSLMMRSIVRLRWLSLAGAACFTTYGVLIEAYPVAVLNLAIVVINVYFLVQMRQMREAFAVVEMPADAPYLTEFLRHHAADIQDFQPGFTLDPAAAPNVLVVLRDLVPAGVLVAQPPVAGEAWVSLDYVTPAYRDFKIGDYLFTRRRDLFRDAGIDRLTTAAGSHEHAKYLERIGFTRTGETYRLDVSQPARA